MRASSWERRALPAVAAARTQAPRPLACPVGGHPAADGPDPSVPNPSGAATGWSQRTAVRGPGVTRPSPWPCEPPARPGHRCARRRALVSVPITDARALPQRAPAGGAALAPTSARRRGESHTRFIMTLLVAAKARNVHTARGAPARAGVGVARGRGQGWAGGCHRVPSNAFKCF